MSRWLRPGHGHADDRIDDFTPGEDRIIGVFRDPSMVVRSLAARAGDLAIGTRKALRLRCAYNSELLRLHRKYRFPLVHSSSDGDFHEDFIFPLTSPAQSIGLDGRTEGPFDRESVHQVEPAPVGGIRARVPLRRLIAKSWCATGTLAPSAPEGST